MARAVKKLKRGHPITAHDIVERYICDSSDLNCITNVCEKCSPLEILQTWDTDLSGESSESESSTKEDEVDSITFSTWTREEGKIKKILKSLDREQFYQQLHQTVLLLKEHIHRKQVQIECYNKQKTELKEGEAIVHVDYSESYKNRQQNEIQSVYFGQSAFSLFTACVYHVDENEEFVKRSICVISESNDHSRAAALTCIDLVIKEVERHICLAKVYLWSDGCASQFRSRFVFKLLSDYRPDLQLEWNYNEAHHGKGPMDGIGSNVKNVIYRQVKSERVTINSAGDFFNAATRFIPSVTCLFQKEKDTFKEPDDIKKASSIPATLKTHKLVRTSTKEGAAIEFSFLSNSPVLYKFT